MLRSAAFAACLFFAAPADAAPTAPAARSFETPAHAFAAALTSLCLPALTRDAAPVKSQLEAAGFQLDEAQVGLAFYAPTPEEKTPATPFTIEVNGVRVWGWVNGLACSVRVNNEEAGFPRALAALKGSSPAWARALSAADPKALSDRDLEIETALNGRRIGLDLGQFAGTGWPDGKWTVFTVAHVARKSWDE